MPGFIAALDQGTTSSRTLIFDAQGQLVGQAKQEFAQHYPRTDWHEQDPEALWQSQWYSLQAALKQAGLLASDLSAIGLCNQRESCLIWHRRSGQALTPVIVWQDRRTSARMQSLGQRLHEQLIEWTGLMPDSYFSASKLEWLLGEYQLDDAARAGDLCAGTIDSWLLWKLTQGQAFATDCTNASRTLLWDLNQGSWRPELLELFNIPAAMLPKVQPSRSHFGTTAMALLGAEIPIMAMAGDQQAATFGQACWSPGQAKMTYGTGCFLLAPTAERAYSSHGLLSTLACQTGAQSQFALEGSLFIGGALVQWLRDNLGIIDQASEIEALASSVPDSGELICVPAFAGLGTPHWDPNARGLLVGLTRATTKAHIARAALEAIAFQCADVLEALQADGVPLNQLKVDGGASSNNLLMQMQADLCGLELLRPQEREATAQGIAWLAGTGIGLYQDEQLASFWQLERTFTPRLSRSQAALRRRQWQRAVHRAREWHQ